MRPCPYCGGQPRWVRTYVYAYATVHMAYCPTCVRTYSAAPPASGCVVCGRGRAWVCARHRGVDKEHGPALPNYGQWHRMLARMRGKASRHLCACRAPATAWSWTGRGHARVDPVRQLAYALDPDTYVPECWTCHARRDGWGHRASRDTAGRFEQTGQGCG